MLYYNFKILERRNKIKNNLKTQDWLPFDKVLENGIIINKNSYKLFLKTCDFNIQILIQSKKENLSKNFYNLKKYSQNENKNIQEITEKYIEFLKYKNEENKSSSKNFYIIIKQEIEGAIKNEDERKIAENIAINYLNECFFKIKESLSRCGNSVFDINSKKESESILMSFFNPIRNNFTEEGE